MAHVHVVVIGLTKREREPAQKRLFSYDKGKGEPVESTHSALSPYLFDASWLGDRHLVVEETSKPLHAGPKIRYGSQPIDGGHLIFNNPAERRVFLKAEPEAKPFVVPFVGSVEYINGKKRWILNLAEAQASTLRSMPELRKRVRAVAKYRSESSRAATRELAHFPTRFAFTTIPKGAFLCIPEVSSERREYVPIGWLRSPIIPSNLVRVIEDAEHPDFAVLTSRMHMAWLRHIGGRLKSDYRYSIGLVYNTFPWPNVTAAAKTKLDTLAQAVLEARAEFPDATLADLYDPDTMPPRLRKAHAALDAAVDRLYRAKPFDSDRERVEHLFPLYEKLVVPLTAISRRAKRRRSRAA